MLLEGGCPSGESCCGEVCCPVERCCDNDECCEEECEACINNGSLSGGSITVTPDPVCIGDTITFTLSGVVDEGGIKRVNCSAKTAIPAVTPTYTWVITKPDASTVNGTGSVATVIADQPGAYSCTFTASADRGCPPADYTIGPGNKTLTFTATLTLDPSFIPATTTWPDMPNYSLSEIAVEWDPPECEGTLEIVDMTNPDGLYLPANDGTLTPINPNLWRYDAFNEAQNELCAEPVKVWIGAMQGGEELARKSIRVLPVHTFWTQDVSRDFQKAYSYLVWKYAAVLATTGGAFSGPPSISPNPLVPCGPLGTLVSACTHLDDSVDFGTSAFNRSENAAASIIGHELVHTVGIIPQSECTAYTWELDHQNQTGIPCDGTYLHDVLLKKIAACGE